AADPLFAMQGPPGSGKTHLLARLALHFALEEEARVLVSAVSHQAIHQALSEIFWVGSRIPACADLLSTGLLKFGASRGSNEGLPEGVRAQSRLPTRQKPLIAGATLYAAAQQALPKEGGQKGLEPFFDVVLFDEAGQAPLTLALAARLLGRRVFFIGDDAQMPPVVELPPEAETGGLCRMSALSFIRERYGDPLLLRKSHRLNEGLCSVVSDCFYGGALESTPKAAERRLRPALKPGPDFAPILDPEAPLVFVDVPHEDCRSVSEAEALWAEALVRECIRCGLAPEDLGVIAPFRAQCNRIRFLLDKVRTTVATVERFQGQEREAVILSLTSSQPGYLSRLAGFLFNPNRLNVAISRARSKVVLLGSKKALLRAAQEGDPDSPSAGGLSVFKKLLGMAREVDGSELPSRVPELFAQGVSEPKALDASVFEPGDEVVHPLYGTGKVLKKSAQMVDGKREWTNEIRFRDGGVRSVIPRLSRPPMRRL
ncbi:MAG: DEAD/DEAH box helicase, partial [Elusimicrobiota bacterium]